MSNASETVREVCAEIGEIRIESKDGRYPIERIIDILTGTKDRILADYDREMAAKDAEIERLRDENVKLTKQTTRHCLNGCDLYDECVKRGSEECLAKSWVMMPSAKDCVILR